ncbi:peptidylprolyl isomerase [bacterium]|nr:peptidylprolyl isomerase [bacterium]
MKKTYLIMILILLLFCCNSTKDKQAAFLTIGDVTYSKDEARIIFNSYPFSVKRNYIGKDGQIDLNAFREFMLKEIVFADKAKKEGLTDQAELQAILKWSAHRLLSQAYIREEIYTNIVSDDELKKLFEEYTQRYSQPEQFHARHILITPGPNPVLYNTAKDDAQDEEQAQLKIIKIQKMLADGQDFSELAKQYSEDMTATDGGDLGFFKKEDMESAFSETLATMKPGEHKGPIKTSFGYHFVQLIETKSSATISFETVKNDILQQAIARQSKSVDQIIGQMVQDRIQQGQVKMP